MGILSRWKEVYITFNYNDFIRCRNLLEDNNVDFKSNVKSRSISTCMEGSGSFSVNRGGVQNDSYTIHVKKSDLELAKHLLNIT